MTGENSDVLFEQMMIFYQNNKDFREFVDRNSKSYNRTVEFELSTETTKQYFLSMQKGGCNEPK